MSSNCKVIGRFGNSVQQRTVYQQMLYRAVIILLFFSVATILCNVIFTVFPVSSIPLIWDMFTAAAIFSIVVISIITYVKRPAATSLVSEIEMQSGIAHPAVSLALELSDSQESFFKDQVNSRAVNQIGVLRNHVPPLIKRTPGIYAFIVVFPLMVASITMPSSAVRYWKTPFSSGHSTGADVFPGSITVPLNKTVYLECKPAQSLFPACKLNLKSPDDGGNRTFFLRSDTTDGFVYKIDSIKKTVIYQFTYGTVSCAPETITVIPPPALYGLRIKITEPSYIGGKEKLLPEGIGDFSAYVGSRINIKIQSTALSSAILHTGTDTVPMQISGDLAQTEFVFKRDGAYTFSLSDTFSQQSDSLPEYRMTILPDENPFVQILKPGYNKELTTAMAETLWIEAADDFGINSMQLQWRKCGGDEEVSSLEILIQKNKPIIRIQQAWNLAKNQLYPGDTLYYWVTVTDNWPFFPRHSAVSDTFWFRVPGFEEIHREIADKENRAEGTIRNVREKQRDISNIVEEVAKSQSSQNEMSWDQKQIIDDLKQNIQAQADSLQSAMNDLQKSADQLKEQGVLGEEIAEKMDQIQKAIEDLIKQYGDSLFQELNKNENVSWNEMKTAIDKVKEMLPELSERLDNTLQFLEMLKRDREIATLAMKAENLAREQSELANAEQNQNTQEQQQKLLDNIDELSKDANASLDKEQMDALKRQSGKIDSLNQKMKSSLNNRKMPQRQSMNEMSSSLLSMSESLKQMMSSAQSDRMEAERNMLLEMAHDALNLAEWQKQITADSDDENELKENAAIQQSLNDALNSLANRSDSLKMVPPRNLQALRELFRKSKDASKEVLKSFGDVQSKENVDRSVSSLHDAANSMLDLIGNGEQQGQCSNGGGMMNSLRKLSGKQRSLNAATSELLRSLMKGSQPGEQPGEGQQPGKGKPGGLQGNGNEQARREAEDAQKKIADELQKLSEQYAKDGDASMAKRLEELEKEAQRLAEMLANPQPEIADRQERFLSRMLQSALSMHKQDEGKDERKSTSAENVFTNRKIESPDQLFQDPDSFYRLRRMALQGNFPENYRQAINAYFDSLGVLYLKNKKE